MNAMWVVAAAVIGCFAPCDYFERGGYEVITKDPQSHYALHVFLNAENQSILRDYGFGRMDGGRHGTFSRSYAAMNAYYGSSTLRNQATDAREKLDRRMWNDETMAYMQVYFRRLRAITFEFDRLVEVFAGELATYGLYPDTAHKWLEECRDACGRSEVKSQPQH